MALATFSPEFPQAPIADYLAKALQLNKLLHRFLRDTPQPRQLLERIAATLWTIGIQSPELNYWERPLAYWFDSALPTEPPRIVLGVAETKTLRPGLILLADYVWIFPQISRDQAKLRNLAEIQRQGIQTHEGFIFNLLADSGLNVA